MAGAGIEIPVSPLNAPVFLSGDDGFGFDEFGDENKAEAKKSHSSEGKISKTKAVILSLLVPGAGQYYAGRKDRAQIFMGAEIASWLGYFAFRTYGNWREDDYKRYAIQKAGITPTSHSDGFYRNLLFYDNREEYNTSGRIINPGAPYYPDLPEYDWHWESTDQRLEYRSMRNAAETAFRKATFMLGVAVFNRIISGIDAFRIAKKAEHRQEDDDFFSRHNLDIDVKANPFGSNQKAGIMITHRF